MEQNAQNGAFYPPSLNPHHSNAFTSSQDPSPFLSSGYPSPGYVPPSAPSAANQGFYTTDPGQGLDHGKSHEERRTCIAMTMAADDSTSKTNTENNLNQAFDGVNKKLSQLENIVQGLECSIEGLKRAGKEQQTESHDKLSRLELLMKEVLTGVQNLNESQTLAGAVTQMKKLQVGDDKASVGDEAARKATTERWQNPNDSYVYMEPLVTSEPPGQHAPAAPPHPPSQNYAAPHNGLALPPSIGELGKPIILHPYAPPLPPGPPQALPPSSRQLLIPHHALQVPLFPYHKEGHTTLPTPAPQGLSNPSGEGRTTLPTPPPQGSSNPSGETAPYGLPHLHQQFAEPHRPPSNSYSEIPQYYGGVPPPHFGSSGNHLYEPAAYTQSRPQSPSPASNYERNNSTGYNFYRTAQQVPSTTSPGGGSHSRLSMVQPPLPGMPGGSNRHQISELTESVVGMGIPREQVRAVVQGLTDSGQPVDLNTILDKLMTRGESSHAQSGGWYNRG